MPRAHSCLWAAFQWIFKTTRGRAGPCWRRALSHRATIAHIQVRSRIGEAVKCGVVQEEIPNPPDLNYLRDVIGLANYLLDNGGIAVAEPQ